MPNLFGLPQAMTSVQSMDLLLAELRALELKITLQMRKERHEVERHFITFFPEPTYEEREFYRKHLYYDHRYFLVTITFDPLVSVNLDEYGQSKRLKNIMNAFNGLPYFACIEEHMSRIRHAHILIETNDRHKIEEILYEHKKNVTKSYKLLPAIKIDCVKQTEKDIDRTYDYIWDHKPNHPEYKFMQINI